MSKRRLVAFTLPVLFVSLVRCSVDDASGTGSDGGTSGSDAGIDSANSDDGGLSPDAIVSSDAQIPGVDGGPGPRAIPDAVLARKAINYSGYREGQSPDTQTYPSEAQIKEDLTMLVRGGFGFIRLFDCSEHGARVLKVIQDDAFDIKVQSGIWIAGNKADHDTENQAEIDRCVALDAKYPEIVVGVSVGNETLDDWSSVKVPATELVAYIQEVRGRVAQPVTTDDMYLPFLLGQDGQTSYAGVLDVAKAVDYLSLHAYAMLDAPYDSWDWQQLAVPEGHARAVAMMNAALQYTKDSIDGVRTTLAGHGVNKPILIGEVGWKTAPATGTDADLTEVYRAHPVNQKMFYDALEAWVYGNAKDATSPKAAFYFEAFDETWKGDDDAWGLFDANRKAKYVMWDAFSDDKPAGAPAYTDDDAVYYKGTPDAAKD